MANSKDRKCPYCASAMELDDGGFLVCVERCQHRTCATCEAPIHYKNWISDPYYVDETDSALCWYIAETQTGMEHMP